MKVPCVIKSRPNTWFTESDDNEILTLLKHHLSTVMLFADHDMKPEMIREISSYKSYSQFLEELLAKHLVFTECENLAGLFSVQNGSNGHGVLPSGWDSLDFELSSRRTRQSAAEIDSFGGNPAELHLRLAHSVKIIDGYFLSTICRNPTLLELLAQSTSGEITVYCQVNPPRTKRGAISQWGETFINDDGSHEQLTDERLQSLLQNYAALSSQVLLQSLAKLNGCSIKPRSRSVKICFFDGKEFPHDRQLETGFLADSNDPDGPLIFDHFALGSGIESLTLDKRNPRRASQLYPSDSQRMWSGFNIDTQNRLFRGAFVLGPNSNNWTLINKP